ncbi:YqjF family protein [Xylanimonas sp. McL0601]|uniref:YqjF family protein n=1 Tax=Xylanimonas sp. McL0601 TaxID=3414739 RepID=UPI003CE9B796
MSGCLPDERVRPALSLQRWERITFVHWRYPVRALEPFVPAGLELQQLDGAAWVGFTPFVLSGLRVPGFPPVPRWSTFAEVNLRTYVTDGRRDGVLFLRVHCARRLVTAAFRAGLGLPYVHVPGTLSTRGSTTTYSAAGARVVVTAGTRVDADPLVASLTGRWSAFTRHAGLLWRIPIEHPPWPLHEARLGHLHTDMFHAAGLPEPASRPLVHYSSGVDTRIGAPRLAARAPASSSA